MATQFNGNGMGGVVPIQVPQGGQPGAYGVQMPVAGQWQPGQQPQVLPTGQQVINGNAGVSYGVESLPPMPQQQQPYMGQQGGYGLTPQWGQGQQQGMQFQQPQQGGFVQQPMPSQQNAGGHAMVAGQQAPTQQLGVPQLGLNTRLDGPGVPQALRGRTLGEALSLYTAMEGSWAQRQGGGQTPAQQSLQQMQSQQSPTQQGQPPAGAQPAQGQQSQPNPWTQPEQFFGGLLERKLEERLGPMIQHTQQQAVTQAYTVAKSGIVDFSGLEPDLMQMLAGADPQSLANPATWVGAADIVRGRQMREGRYQPPSQQQLGVQQVQVPGQQPSWQSQNPAQLPGQPAGQQFGQVPVHGFFTESPTAPSVSQFGAGVSAQPTQQDYQMAGKFQMPIQDWMAWKTGVSAQQQGMGGAR